MFRRGTFKYVAVNNKLIKVSNETIRKSKALAEIEK